MRLLQKEHLLIFQSTLPDPRSRAPVTAIARFQSTLPAWGETQRPQPPGTPSLDFNPLSPHGERPGDKAAAHKPKMISIHSPRMGRDGLLYHIPNEGKHFNPLSPHGERLGSMSDLAAEQTFQSTLPAWGETASSLPQSTHSTSPFQSTLPAWGETDTRPETCRAGEISIHSPRMGRDWPASRKSTSCWAFQSTLPAWGETARS